MPKPILVDSTGFGSLCFQTKGGIVVKLTLRERESVQEAVRRFRKLVERSGIKKEMRRREYYEKPSETKRRARLRAERRSRRLRTEKR
jgi:small subunit ribosomal protein S21